MSIDFSALKELTIPEGVVTQITDATGNILWSAAKLIVLEVEKITSDTYAAETTYTDEEFILLDIYPKTNGTVEVSYGGLTKTITDTSGAEEPNAQQVFFGTFNGVSDSVETPASGILTVKGDYRGVGNGSFNQRVQNKTTAIQKLYITAVIDIGKIVEIPDAAFQNADFSSCADLKILKGVVEIGSRAFSSCVNLVSVELPEGLETIGGNAFEYCYDLVSVELPEGLETIGGEVFVACRSLTSIVIPASVKQIRTSAFSFGNMSPSNDGISCRRTVIMLSTTPPTIGTDVFKDETGNGYGDFCHEAIIVPQGCAEAYKTAENWSEYADIIVEAS